MRRFNSFLIYAFLAVFLFAVGCTETPVKIDKKTPIQSLNAPEWVQKGGGAYGGERGRVFYGVGSSYGIRNLALKRETSDNRARADIVKIFKLYVASLAKDYAASTMAGDPNVTSEEQHVERALKTVMSMTLSGSEIVDHWENPATGELFALARLDLQAFKDNTEKANELNSRVKEYIKKNAGRLHDELDKEVEKLEAKEQSEN